MQGNGHGCTLAMAPHVTNSAEEERLGEGISQDRKIQEENTEQDSDSHNSVSPLGHLYAN